MARPKGSLKYKSAKALHEAIEQYFSLCDEGRVICYYNPKKGKREDIKMTIPYTVEGLADHLGVVRQTLLNYSEDPRFLDIITRAKEKISRRLMEDALLGATNPVMAKLNLAANFGYSDKQEIGVSTTEIDFGFS